MTTPHSKIGASTCERWWNCPGSVAACAVLPPQPESPYAKEGTAAHELGERCLLENKDAVELVGQTAENGVEFTFEMAEAVQVYLDTIRQDMDHYKSSHTGLKIEHRFHLTDVDPDAFGTNDAMLGNMFGKLIVYDYKHGQGVAVEVVNNKQALYYAVGGVALGDYDSVELVIVQPRASHRDGPVRRWNITMDTLIEFTKELREKITETKKEGAPLVAGEHCKKTFCPNMAGCKAIKNIASQAAMVAFGEAKPLVLKEPDHLTPNELKRILDAMPMVEAWLTSVYAFAEQKLKNGEEVIGYKLVKGREGNRQWVDEKKVLAHFGKEAEKIEVLSPAQLEKVIGKKRKEELDPFVTRSEGKISMVPETDSREAVSSQAQAISVFAKNDEIENLFN